MTPAQAASMSAQMEKGFYPYDYNGGTCLAIAGKDFVVVAGDTRMSTGFNIKSRHVSKLFKLTGDTVLATAGFRGDITTLQKLLRVKLTQYEHQHGEGGCVRSRCLQSDGRRGGRHNWRCGCGDQRAPGQRRRGCWRGR